MDRQREEYKRSGVSESRTDVELINRIQPGRDNLSENRTPKGLLPP
jgi:hypothetical protein